MVRFRLSDGRMLSTNDLPITEADQFIVGEADQGMTLHCFQSDEGDQTSLTHIISVGIRHKDVPGFVAQVIQCAEGMGVDWQGVRIREVPESGPTSTGH